MHLCGHGVAGHDLEAGNVDGKKLFMEISDFVRGQHCLGQFQSPADRDESGEAEPLRSEFRRQ
jgi:hypothetical protein